MEWHLIVMAVLYIIAGILHFVKPRIYESIMPPYIPAHHAMVLLSGFAESALGIGLLFQQTRILSAWGIVLLLIAIFPANVYMATSQKFHRIPSWILWARLPLQAVLIAWALRYT